MNPVEFIGFIAAALSCISLIPEVHQALRTHHLKDVAWGMLLMMTLSSFFWLVYGTYNDVMPLIVSSALQLALQVGLIGLKILYDKNNKPLFILPQKKSVKTAEHSEEETSAEPVDGPFIEEDDSK